MNAYQSRLPQIKTQPTIDYYVRHYMQLIWRWKWFIAIVAPTVLLIWTAMVVKYVDGRPNLESRATLQFNFISNNLGPIDEQSAALQKSSCDAFLRSRPFLENVVQKLSLQCSVKKYFRNDIFDSMSIEPSVTPGKYDFVIENDSYTLYYTNERREIHKRVVAAGKLFELTSFSFPSVSLKLTHDFISEPHNFTFFILSLREAVDQIRWSFQVNFPGDPEQRQQAPVMVLSLKGNDYPLTTEIINVIADDFVEHNASIKQTRKSGAIEVLEKQLQAARSTLAGADEAMRQFRQANPSVGAISTLNNSVTEVANLEGTSATMNHSISEATLLQARCKESPTVDEQLTALFEAITFLTTRQAIAAPALQLELNDVTAEKRRVDADYAPQHPLVLENRKKISRVASNISKALSDLIDKMQSDVVSITSRKSALTAEFQKLPSKELKYSELERRRSNAAELYNNMLTRYNVNKMSEVSQGNDVFVLDHAVIPNAPGRLQSLLQFLLIGVVISLGVGFVPPIGVDYLDKRPRNEEDCRRFSSLPYLEGIPAKVADKKKKKANKEKIDSLLVAGSFEAGVFDEMYRSLRTKILLHLHGEKNKMLVVTSLNVGEGKSLTASNISIVMAQQKLRTLLIDGDLRRGVQHNSFVLQKKPGLSEILSSPDELTTIPINSMIQQTHIPNLSLLSCGMPVPNPAECMNSQKFRDLIAILTEWFDVIILDTPPLRVAVDAAILPEAFNHYIVVVRAAKTNIVAAEKKIGEFPGLRPKVLGVVLNGAPVDQKAKDYRYSYYRA
jgi:polysaccharide biosynthesis transport protein